MAKQRGADWQLDLRPVALTPRSPGSLPPAENGAAAPPVERPTDNAALLNTLTAVTTAVSELSRAVAAIGQRLDGLERAAAEQSASSQSLANQLLTNTATATAAAAEVPASTRSRSTRAVRPTTRSLRDSTTAPLERRSRRSAAEAKPDADAKPAE